MFADGHGSHGHLLLHHRGKCWLSLRLCQRDARYFWIHCYHGKWNLLITTGLSFSAAMVSGIFLVTTDLPFSLFVMITYDPESRAV
jgi:hypothetical protein